MSIKSKYIIIVLIAGALMTLGALINQSCNKPKTKILVDSVFVPKYSYKIDTVKVNIDSLWQEAKRFWQKKPKPVIVKVIKKDTVYLEQPVKYIASLDTTIKDKQTKLNISFNSPIPLHPKSFFKIKAEYLPEPMEVSKSWFTNRFIIYLGVGVGNNTFYKPEFQLGFGIRLK